MIDNFIMAIVWIGSQQIVQIALLRYLILENCNALYISQFFIRLASIIVFLIVFIHLLWKLKQPQLNSPHNFGQPFRFNFLLVFFCSLLEFVTISMSIHALKYYSIVHYIALFKIFKAFFRSLINNVTPMTAFGIFLLMGLGYLLEDWIYFVDGSLFETRVIAIKNTFDWQPLIMVGVAAASRTLGIFIFKKIQFQQLFNSKGQLDKISWANYINDEPDKVKTSLTVVNALFSKYLEAQLIIHCEQNSIPIYQLRKDALQELLDSYFDNHLSYSLTYMEQFQIFNFNKEAKDDPDLYADQDSLLRRMIKQRVYQIQLQHQQYKELFGIDKYENLSYEVIFQDYGIHEYIWDQETPIIKLTMSFFEGLFCFIAAFFNEEQNQNYFSNGYNISIEQNDYYIWISIFLGILFLGNVFAHKLIILWNVETYFFCGIIIELGIIYLAMIWIEPITYIQVLGLIIAYLILTLSYRSAEKVRDQKNKLFYLNFVIFLVRSQKFSKNEGNQIILLMKECCEHLNLNEFLKVLSQMLCVHGIVSPKQLRYIKFSHFGQSPFFNHQIPFIFQSQLMYENNIENGTLVEEEQEIQQQEKSEFNRYVISSPYQQQKSEIVGNQKNSRIIVKSEIQYIQQPSKVLSRKQSKDLQLSRISKKSQI